MWKFMAFGLKSFAKNVVIKSSCHHLIRTIGKFENFAFGKYIEIMFLRNLIARFYASNYLNACKEKQYEFQ
jgi:hypothetical protein